MKLLVCDIEGTIFQPNMIKDSRHASYIWTSIAEKLGKDAEREEIKTQIEWDKSKNDKGRRYIKWVQDSIDIHIRYGLTQDIFNSLIDSAPYVYGVEKFFKYLNRDEYIPIFISGGIQNLSERACSELGVDFDNSYASCKYYFDSQGKIDKDLTLFNTSNFSGKYELVKIALRKYGLGINDWIFIGDGINDVHVASKAKLSIGIDPVEELSRVVDKSVMNFHQLLDCHELIEKWNLIVTSEYSAFKNSTKEVEVNDSVKLKEYLESVKTISKQRAEKNVSNLHLPQLEKHAWRQVKRVKSNSMSIDNVRSRLFGIVPLLEAGEYTFALLTDVANEDEVAVSTLQPFCNATEIMIYVCCFLLGKDEALRDLINAINKPWDSRKDMKTLINSLGNDDLCSVMNKYLKIRNISAHSHQSISIPIAKSFIQSSYEGIQRMQLIVKPF